MREKLYSLVDAATLLGGMKAATAERKHYFLSILVGLIESKKIPYYRASEHKRLPRFPRLHRRCMKIPYYRAVERTSLADWAENARGLEDVVIFLSDVRQYFEENIPNLMPDTLQGYGVEDATKEELVARLQEYSYTNLKLRTENSRLKEEIDRLKADIKNPITQRSAWCRVINSLVWMSINGKLEDNKKLLTAFFVDGKMSEKLAKDMGVDARTLEGIFKEVKEKGAK